MKRPSATSYGISTLALLVVSSLAPGALGTAQAQTGASNGDRNVIVILRDQVSSVSGQRGSREARAASIALAQAPVLDQMAQMGARNLRSFRMFNLVAATVTQTQAEQLAAHPQVQAVVSDAVIRKSRRSTDLIAALGSSDAPPGSATSSALCNTLEPEALQLTNTAFSDTRKPQAQTVLDGKGIPVTGRGVKVAFIADGLDPTLPGFTRPDGTSVFVDYQDFSGDPAGTPTGAGEAFGDASSIAAQDMPNGRPLTFDISQFVNPAHPLPAGCSIRIRGMAPGASLVALKVFGAVGFATTSSFVQAIEWAVLQDDVDVINESFGQNPFPDNANDPISIANNAAVRAGVTVVASTGDAGTAGTLGYPVTDPNIIAAGASTQFRFYAQTGYGIAPLLGGGYASNNISSLSSGGFSQLGARTVDVVAPGDGSWALCSTNTSLYADCTNLAGRPSPIESFGGTSESAPLIAGEAALIIQAYRSTHYGADPTPALVKQIILSTATDLGAPTDEQGAGLINSLAAVNAALSIREGSANAGLHGQGLLIGPDTASFTAFPNTNQDASFTVTNTGNSTLHLAPALQTLGIPIAGATVTVTLSPTTDPTFLNVTGAKRSYKTTTFTVPAGAQHLDAAIAWPNPLGTSKIAYLALVNPSGAQQAYSLPQGLGSGYGHVDVVKPAAGTWTAYIWTRPSGSASVSGPVKFTWAAEKYVNLGTVSPSSFDLPAGASRTITAQFTMPYQPGDLAAGIRFAAPSTGSSLPEVPITLRTLVPIGSTGGSFSGTLTGGNGRPGAGPTQTFAFDVPRGVNDMSLGMAFGDAGYLMEGLLVDPNGMQLSVEGNIDANGSPQPAMQLFRANPQPGRWRFVLLQNFTSSGNQTSQPFQAAIGFNQAQISAPLPNDPRVRLSASVGPVTVNVSITNTGAVTQAYFADARLAKPVVMQLGQYGCYQGSQATTLPGACAQYLVPTQAKYVKVLAQSTAPITMDAYNLVGYGVGFTGAPDIYAKQIGPSTIAASISEPEVPFGFWQAVPSLVGPYGAAGVLSAPIAVAATALMKPFDLAVSASSGDAWADLTLGTNTYNPLVLAPGQTGTIALTITPDPTQVGKVVSGFVYIDTFNFNVTTGDEVVSIPYTYTVTP
jgi:hypothetical protein